MFATLFHKPGTNAMSSTSSRFLASSDFRSEGRSFGRETISKNSFPASRNPNPVFSVRSTATNSENQDAVVTGTSGNVFFTVSSEGSEAAMRSERIHQLGIEFIPSDEFAMLDAAQLYPKCVPLAPAKASQCTRVAPASRNITCLAPALNEPLLAFAEEQHLFRRMNFLKYSAARLRDSLDVHQPSHARMDQIERYLVEAKASRDQIIRANLRLVISNAKKYCSPQYSFEDLVSDGTLALMEAVEKFDYQRGFRFSTYATHAIRRSIRKD